MRLPIILGALAVLATGCTPPTLPTTGTGTAVAPDHIYANTVEGFSFHYPENASYTTVFSASYLVPDTWSILDEDDTGGKKVVEVVLPESNEIMAAGLRVGAGDPKYCGTVPSYATFETGARVINGNTFGEISLSDAAMSHSREVRSFRIMHKNQCLIFDEFVSGTNGQVYDPPRTAPFTKEEGFSRLDAMLNTLILL